MTDLIRFIEQLIVTHQDWAGPIIAILAFFESMVLIGLLVPATALLIFTGGLIGAGLIEPVPVLIWGMIGAILGDTAAFYVGRYFGWGITRKPLLAPHRRFFIRARLCFKRWGTFSVFAGRFMGPIRSTIPTVAGIMNMKPLQFQLANIASGILWVPVMLSPGYFAAKNGKDFLNSSKDSGLGDYFILLTVLLGIGLIVHILWPRRRRNNDHHPPA